MNVQHTNAKISFPTQIVARYSADHGPLAVLRTDEEHPQEVQAVALNKGEVIVLPIEAYKKTERVSKSDMSLIASQYARFANVPEAIAMERQGYKKKKSNEIPNQLVDVNVETGDVKVSEEMIKAATPEQAKVMQHINASNTEQPEQKKRRQYRKLSPYWAAGAPKKRRAKPVEAQPVDVMAGETFPTSVIEAANDSFRNAKEAAAQQAPHGAQGLDAEAIAKIVAEATRIAVTAALKKAA